MPHSGENEKSKVERYVERVKVGLDESNDTKCQGRGVQVRIRVRVRVRVRV
jgi:hypothetical protein